MPIGRWTGRLAVHDQNLEFRERDQGLMTVGWACRASPHRHAGAAYHICFFFAPRFRSEPARALAGQLSTIRVDILPKRDPVFGQMSTQRHEESLDLLQGTLDLLILRTLIFEPQHGHAIARAIQQTSEHELLVEHGALYPALQRLEAHGWIAGKWGVSSNNRRARFYSLTTAGRHQLVKETSKWKRLATAIARVLDAHPIER
jgi:PadR family transcriptional regulator PadR